MSTFIKTCKNLFRISILMLVQVLLCAICFANVLPYFADDIPCTSIGVYQTDTRITVYEAPDEKSKVLLDKEILYKNLVGLKKDNMFGILLPQKELGYLYVVDTSDDENWVKVIYDKQNNKTGWVYKKDEFQFMPWIDFINIYGRKYGVFQLKSYTKYNNVYSNPNEESQVLGQISHSKVIRLTAVEGNWLLVTALDLSGDAITGYIIWRTPNGGILLFPSIK